MDESDEYKKLRIGIWTTTACFALGIIGYIVSKLQSTDGFAWGTVCYVLAYLSGGYGTATSALDSLRRFKLNVDTLMLLAALGAAILGEWGEGVVLLFLFSLSGTLETYAVYRTNRAIESIMKLRPRVASKVKSEGGEDEVVLIESLVVGDQVRIKPGECIPVDGEVVEGEAWADESSLTGESNPVEKFAGCKVFAGAMNSRGTLIVRMSKNPEDFTIQKTIQLVHDAQARSTPSQRFVESWQQPYVILVLAAALMTFLGTKYLHTKEWGDAFYHAMVVLVAASPCAVVLSVPAVMLSAIAVAGRNGVLVKGPMFLELLSQTDTIAFDKTGTITRGKPTVTEVWTPKESDPNKLLLLAGLIEAQSEHPLAIPILAELKSRGISLPAEKIKDFQSHTGTGVHGTVMDHWVGVGKEALFQSHDFKMPDDLKSEIQRMRSQGMTALPVVTSDPKLYGAISVIDPVRKEAEQSIRELKELKIERLVMLTGDDLLVAKSVTKNLPLDQIFGGLMPEDKVKHIAKLTEGGHVVAMVGDGVNDAPALAAAQIGIAMGNRGSDVALDVADVVLMHDDLRKLPFAIRLGKVAQQRVRVNLRFAFGMILILLIASFFDMPLWLGVVGHEGSTLLVVFNGVRLLVWKDRHGQPDADLQ
ncbi:MAG: heavy metal translocating P-type ATPase [Pirellula sp.]|jgi:Cd2+/Zn2+-exporting ATPase